MIVLKLMASVLVIVFGAVLLLEVACGIARLGRDIKVSDRQKRDPQFRADAERIAAALRDGKISIRESMRQWEEAVVAAALRKRDQS